MAIVERNRILRPSTRLASSISYKINTEKVSGLDELIVRVYLYNYSSLHCLLNFLPIFIIYNLHQ